LSLLKGGNAVAALINAPVIYQALDIGMNKIVSVTELNIPLSSCRLHDQGRLSSKSPNN